LCNSCHYDNDTTTYRFLNKINRSNRQPKFSSNEADMMGMKNFLKILNEINLKEELEVNPRTKSQALQVVDHLKQENEALKTSINIIVNYSRQIRIPQPTLKLEPPPTQEIQFSNHTKKAFSNLLNPSLQRKEKKRYKQHNIHHMRRRKLAQRNVPNAKTTTEPASLDEEERHDHHQISEELNLTDISPSSSEIIHRVDKRLEFASPYFDNL
jgi:hypothetical protein